MSPEDVPDEVVALFYDASALCADFTNDERPIRAGLAAVLPAHEAMVRAKVIAEIEAKADDMESGGWTVVAGHLRRTAEILRGSSHE
jgi:hypothetical protein